MGLFLSMSGVVGADEEAVEGAIRDYVLRKGGKFEPHSPPPDEKKCLILSRDKGGVVVVYPREFAHWDDLSGYISEQLKKPAFSFHIHDGDLWMYLLFNCGEQVDQFNAVPDYWEDYEPGERHTWQGNADTIESLVPDVSASSISGYLTFWDPAIMEADELPKAYADDEFTYGVDWQLTDFMRRLGLSYPVDDRGNIKGRTFLFKCR